MPTNLILVLLVAFTWSPVASSQDTFSAAYARIRAAAEARQSADSAQAADPPATVLESGIYWKRRAGSARRTGQALSISMGNDGGTFAEINDDGSFGASGTINDCGSYCELEYDSGETLDVDMNAQEWTDPDTGANGPFNPH